MKNLFNSAWRCRENYSAKTTWFFCTLILTGILFSSCKKESVNAANNADPVSVANAQVSPENDNANVLTMYSGLGTQTLQELQQARAATARYRNIKNAIEDGYSNISVDVPNMGHHLMKSALVDASFDIRHPEILVYNGLETGNPELIAVEYALPLNLPLPEGFTGASDVWNGTSGFPLWLVHAWVWKYNPAGVFNWTNPLVDLD